MSSSGGDDAADEKAAESLHHSVPSCWKEIHHVSLIAARHHIVFTATMAFAHGEGGHVLGL
jgi:hypothetical protein